MKRRVTNLAGQTQAVNGVANGKASARAGGLHYVSDDAAGIRRIRAGQGFRYVNAARRSIRAPAQLGRIRSLAIPPAWTDVWICSDPNGHLQATGRDARGRKQFRYHSRWNEVRDENKYDRVLGFAKALPRIRRRVSRDLARRGLCREKVLATIIRLLETTLIRVGNEEYARQNDSVGLTTLRDCHVDVNGSKLRFEFRGKSGVKHAVDVNDPRLAGIVRDCQELPGQELFQYVDGDGVRHAVTSADVNDYLRDISGDEFTSKDFRTWAGTVLAGTALMDLQPCDSAAQTKRNVVQAVSDVARRLGNTKAVCRKSYIHPALIDAYIEGSLAKAMNGRAGKTAHGSANGLRRAEAATFDFLRARLRGSRRGRRKRSVK